MLVKSKLFFLVMLMPFILLKAQTPSDAVIQIKIGGKTVFYNAEGEVIDSSAPLKETTPEKSIDLTEEINAADNWNVQDDASKMAATITVKDLKKHLRFLASDKLEGRETGTRGQREAAEYIADEFRDYGLPTIGENKTSYYQKVPLITEDWQDISITVNGNEFEHLKDFYSFSKTNRPRISTKRDEVIYLGYGIEDENYSDYEGIDVKGKIILIYQGEPRDKDNVSYITGKTEASEWTDNYKEKLQLAKKKGVRSVLMIERNIPFYVHKYNYRLRKTYFRLDENDPARRYCNSLYISPDVAKAIIGKKFERVVEAREFTKNTGEPLSVRLDCDITIKQDEKHGTVNAENVLGFIEGTDPVLKDEVVVVTAHYDHLGRLGDDIYNGADDNGSGTSVILEIAEAFVIAKQEGKGPKRSILVMAVSGEEKGLLGSEYYSEEPVFLPENTVANVNVDMVGRIDEKHEKGNDYIYVIGADRLSQDLHDINEAANAKYTNLELDYTYNALDDPNNFYERSDHYNFAKKGIPAIFYFNGTHRDYHRITDTEEKIEYKKMQQRARLIFLTTWEIANRQERLRLNN